MAILRIDNLKKVMEVKGWNQSDLARRTNCHRSYISYLLRGKRKPSADFVMAVGRILPGFEQDEFFLPEVLTDGNGNTNTVPKVNTEECNG